MIPVHLRVYGTPTLSDLRPVRGGVPLAQGAAPAGSAFALTDANGVAVPTQSEVLATWPDGSVKWVLLDVQAAPPAGGALDYTLTCSPDGQALAPALPVLVDGASMRTGSLALTAPREALLELAGHARIHLIAEDGAGTRWTAATQSVAASTTGPLRGTLCLCGSFCNADGDRWFDFRLWVSLFAGLSRVLLEPLVLMNADAGLVQRIRSLRLVIEPTQPITRASMGTLSGAECAARLMQLDDQQFSLNGAALQPGRAPGWAQVEAGTPLAVAVGDFWQQWPKALSADDRSLSVELLPAFSPGDFDHMQPWYKHDYLFEGDCYRLRTGQARRWQVWLDVAGGGPALSEAANQPLVVSTDPAQALATGVWGPQVPAGTKATADYDVWAEQLFDVYMLSLEKHRDYGAMNWGDWWGERRSNWGNHEYDTPLHMLVQFARTGDPKYLHAGEITARHMAEVDVVHAANEDLARYYREDIGHGLPARAGIVHQHTIGHVGGFHPVEQIRELYKEIFPGHPNPYLCLDPNNLGHVFTQGMAYHYLLTGDPWVREALREIGENLCALIDEKAYKFKGWDHCGRVNGWTMLALAGCHDVAPSERFLAAMHSLAEDALEEQDPHCGGWLYQLPRGHCDCVTRKHVGEAGFISAVRINGLARYHGLTGDERIPEVIRRAVTHLNNDTWREEHTDWRYTSCPQSPLMHQFGVIMMALRNSVVLTGDEGHLRILRVAWAAKFARLQKDLRELLSGDDERWLGHTSMGKEYGGTAYGCGETVGLLASLDD